MSLLRRVPLALAFALLAGCSSGTETGNPSQTASLALAVHSTSPGVGVGPGTGGTHVESAWLKVSSVRRGDCSSSELQQLSEGFVIESISGGMELSAIDLGQDPLCVLELTLSPEAAAPNDAPAELGASSLVVTGTRDDGAPFVVATPSALTITLHAPAPIDPTHYEGLFVAFDLGIWFTGTDLSAVTLDAEGVARLGGIEHPDSVLTFEGQIAPGTGLYPDLDGDEVFDPEDLAQPLAGH